MEDLENFVDTENEEVGATDPTESSTEEIDISALVDAAFNDELDDDGNEVVENEADQPSDHEEEQPIVESKPSEDHITYELKRQGEKKTVTIDEMKALAQQHWDYPHVRSERDLAKAKADFYEKTFENSKGQWDDIWGLIDDCNAQALIQSEAKNGRVLNYNDAIANVKANREAIFSPKTIKELEAEEFEGVKNQDINLLTKLYPDVDFNKTDAISEDVWKTFRENGGNLTAAYQQSIIKGLNDEIARLKKEYESVEQNVKNKMRSSGSSHSSGSKETTLMDMLNDAWKD